MYVAVHFDVFVLISKLAVLPVGQFHAPPMGVPKQYIHVVQQFIVYLVYCPVPLFLYVVYHMVVYFFMALRP